MEQVQKSLPKNPKEKANVFSKIFLLWTVRIFKQGYSKVLELGDLYQPLTEDRSESLGNRLEKKWKQQEEKDGKPSLLRAICKTFWREYSLMALIVVFNDIFVRLAQPVLLGQLLTYFRKDSTMKHEDALYYAGGIIVLNGINAMCFNHYTLDAFHNGMKVRVAVCSLIYRKALRLSHTALGNTAPGKVVNLLSNDVNRFDIVSIFIHSMWSAPLLSFVVGIMLWFEAGWAGMVGIAVVFIVVPLQSYTGKLSSKFRLATALRTDERIRFMDEIILGVQVIKMYAWEKPFSKLIALARRLELKVVRKNSYVRALFMTFTLFTTRMAIFCTMLAIVLSGQELTAAKVFVISAYFNIIAQTMSAMFVRGVAEIAEALVAFKRLQNFLVLEEKGSTKEDFKLREMNKLGLNGDVNEKQNLLESENQVDDDVVLSIKNATARWVVGDSGAYKPKKSKKEELEAPVTNGIQGNATLENIDFTARQGQLIGVIGGVGAGKTSLLQLILKELPLESGSLVIKGNVSFTCQEPWVFAGSVRQNILFGEDMLKHKYDAVVKTCALEKDFEQFEHGDKTIIGERGVSLSGGQRARLSLARAIYRDADLYLLDDPLSAVDAHVGKHLFEACIGPKGRLQQQKATRILITHQIHFLKDADWVIVLKDGKIEMQGSPEILSKSGIDLAKLLEAENVESENDPLKRQRSRTQSKSSIASSLHSIHDDDEENNEKNEIEKSQEIVQMEATSKGTVQGSVAANYLRAGGNPFIVFFVILLFLLTQAAASLADVWVSYWAGQEELRTFYTNNNQTTSEELIFDDIFNNTAAVNDTLDIPIYDPLDSLMSTQWLINIHAILVCSIFLIGIVRSVSFYSICIKASQNLHDGMFKGVVTTTMRFFDTNPSGRILNRFSKDIGGVDELLPKGILDAGQFILMIIGSLIVTSTVQAWFLAPLAVLSVFFFYVRKVYLKTSKNIKRLDGITRSPVFTHLAASLNGLSTIRAFKAEPILIEEFDSHQDSHTATWYLFISTSTAFGICLDLICLVFIAIVTFNFLLLDMGVLGDRVGLVITQAMSLTGILQWGIRQSAEVANQLMAVERLLEYRDLEPEKQPEVPREVSKTWPEQGKLEFKNVVYRYFEGAEPVLKQLSFSVKPCEKIGIVGRTGAGKSSLIGAIFRLAQVEGGIVLDGVDTSTISLQDLRSKVSIIPQDPVLFSGTVRRNLDPFEEYPDSSIWQALEQVKLKDIASGPSGLQSPVTAGGGNFSVGQRQLLCLARAILRNNKLLVLDEATANVDPHTDSLIQLTIRTRFEDCTVLTVAHRLHTIMDSDRVLVMSFGQATEFDSPHALLQKPGGYFKDMVQATGPGEAERLAKIAREKFESIHKLS